MNNNSFIKNYWSSAYKRIGLCNRFLEGIANAPESEQKTRMIAEARFLRATQYHYLASYFKDVPLVTKTLTGEEANIVEKETPVSYTHLAGMCSRITVILNILAWRLCQMQVAIIH